MSLEKSPFIELKFATAEATTQAGEFMATIAAYGNLDLVGDVIQPGAFTASLAQHRANGTTPALLWNHNPDSVIGVWTALEDSPAGLTGKGRLILETQRGLEAHALMKAGALACSIGYKTIRATFDAKGNRLLHELDLREASLVACPANHRARITSVKSALSAGEIITPRMLESVLRDAGIPKAMAAGVIAKGFRGATDTRSESASLACKSLLQSVAAHTALIKRS